MSFELLFQPVAEDTLLYLREKAKKSAPSSRHFGLYKQIHEALLLVQANPKHPGLRTHEYSSLENPFHPNEKVFEAYAQNNTPGAYRVFWCYGPNKRQITIIAITPHP